jgi:predicted CXXCH cytochrome family protein
VVDEGAMHSIIEEDGCQACHDPHSSDNAKLLSGPAEGLCS